MNPYLALKLELQRLAQARAGVQRQLDAIEQQIRAEAEMRAIATVGGKARPYHRNHSSAWRPTHERAYRAHMAQLADVRDPEIRALQRKLDRQDAAIVAFRRRNGLNIDAAELLGRNLQHDFEES